MKVDFLSLYLIYLLVFLAVIITAWLIAAWRQRCYSESTRPVYLCAVCGGRIPGGHALIHIRCPACGVRNRIETLRLVEPGKSAAPQPLPVKPPL